MYGDGGNASFRGEEGKDRLFGGAGADTVQGDDGAGRMYGGLGADVFVSVGADESGTKAGRIDSIFGFVTQGADAAEADRIDLTFVGDLTFIGTDAFTAAGQVRLYQAAGGTFVMINLNGADRPEMKIALVDIAAADLGIDDFIL